MKNFRHYIFYALLIAGLIFLIVKVFEYQSELSAVKKADSKVKAKIETEAKEIKRQVDEKGVETVLFEVTGNQVASEQAESTKGSKGLIDTTALALDVKTKQLKQILVVNGTLAMENIQLKQKLDAMKKPYYTYSGEGLDLRFTPPSGIEADTIATASFTANVGLTATQYWKRDWFLGSKKSILAVRPNNNKNFKINGADFVEFEQKQPTFGLRVQASTSYNFETGSLGFGPAVRFDAGRFSFQGRYSKFPNNPKWKPSVNASYDLLRF